MKTRNRPGVTLHLPGLLLTAGLASAALAATAGPTTARGTVQGTIVDWPKGKTGTVLVGPDSKGVVDANGHFTITLPEQSEEDLKLANVSELFVPTSNLRPPEDVCTGQGTAAPASAHFAIYELAVSIEGDEPTTLKLRSDAHWPLPVGQVYGQFNHFDVPTTLDGTVTCTGVTPPVTFVYQGTFPAGWSLPTGTVTALSTDGVYTERLTPDPLPTNLAWRLYDLRAGLGVQLNAITEGSPGVKVTGVTPGQPADQAGVKANDLLTEIDGKDVTALSVNQVVALLRGPENAAVTLGVRRGSETTTRQIRVVRALIRVR